MKRISEQIKGRVQGVFFRAFVQEQAKALGIFGWVKNTPDGAVSIEAEGNEASINAFLESCKKGPPNAIVQSVDVKLLVPINKYTSFQIR